MNKDKYFNLTEEESTKFQEVKKVGINEKVKWFEKTYDCEWKEYNKGIFICNNDNILFYVGLKDLKENGINAKINNDGYCIPIAMNEDFLTILHLYYLGK